MRIGLFHRQQPFAEYVNGKWRVYYIFNNDVTGGTYFELASDGTCDRVTFRDGDVVSVQRVATGAVSDDWQRHEDAKLALLLEQALEQEFIRGASL